MTSENLDLCELRVMKMCYLKVIDLSEFRDLELYALMNHGLCDLRDLGPV